MLRQGLRRGLASCLKALQTPSGALGELGAPPATWSASASAQVVRDWQLARRGQVNLATAAADAAPASLPLPPVPPVPCSAQPKANGHGVKEPGQVQYRIEVVTGDVRGAGSPSPAIITLYGSGAWGCEDDQGDRLPLSRRLQSFAGGKQGRHCELQQLLRAPANVAA